MEKRTLNGRKVLVTSGGTSEPIDTVRRITNSSTGRLGSLIADAFTQAGADVTYLHGHGASKPSQNVAILHEVSSVQKLDEALEELLTKNQYTCVIHAMAVSDYTPKRIITAADLSDTLCNLLDREDTKPSRETVLKLVQTTIRGDGAEQAGKISSDLDDALIVLKRTPKLIGKIKTLQPDTILVGFKLLSGVSENELESVASKLLARNNCDFVLANDQTRIKDDNHEAFLISSEGIISRMETKEEIAREIVNAIGKTLEETI